MLISALYGGREQFIKAIQRTIGQEKTALYQEQILDAAEKNNIPDLMTITIGGNDLVALIADLIKNPREVDKIIEFSSGYRKTLRLIRTKIETFQRYKRGLTGKKNKNLDVIVLNIYEPTDQTDCLFKVEQSFNKRMYGFLKRINHKIQFFAKKNK